MKMSLQDWLANGWLRSHQTSPQEIRELLAIVDRDMRDAASQSISADWRFGIAYNAALKLCTILLYSEGYRPEKTLAHYRTLQALPLVLGVGHESDARYLDTCRIKRNTVEYHRAGAATEADANELSEFVAELRKAVLQWVSKNHSTLR
jgi:hypothetical protein